MIRPEQIRGRGFKSLRRRLQSLQKERGEAWSVVKGVNKRVVVVRSPNPKVFEEAIFIVRDDFWCSGDGDSARLLQEAKAAAETYLRPNGRGLRRRAWDWQRPLCAAAGALAVALAVALAWLAVRFVGVLF